MLISYKRGQGSVILRIKIRNSSVPTGAGLTGIAFNTSNLIVSTIADNEATPTVYTGSNLETVTVLGTYAAPTAGKARFREVDATNHKGIYEVQLADARYAVSGAKSLLISISGVLNAAECDVVIPLVDINPYDPAGWGAGTGSITHTIYVIGPDGNAITGAEVWVSTDAAGLNVVAGTRISDDAGKVVFYLDAGTYYAWRDHPSFNFNNPTTITVSA